MLLPRVRYVPANIEEGWAGCGHGGLTTLRMRLRGTGDVDEVETTSFARFRSIPTTAGNDAEGAGMGMEGMTAVWRRGCSPAPDPSLQRRARRRGTLAGRAIDVGVWKVKGCDEGGKRRGESLDGVRRCNAQRCRHGAARERSIRPYNVVHGAGEWGDGTMRACVRRWC